MPDTADKSIDTDDLRERDLTLSPWPPPPWNRRVGISFSEVWRVNSVIRVGVESCAFDGGWKLL